MLSQTAREEKQGAGSPETLLMNFHCLIGENVQCMSLTRQVLFHPHALVEQLNDVSDDCLIYRLQQLATEQINRPMLSHFKDRSEGHKERRSSMWSNEPSTDSQSRLLMLPDELLLEVALRVDTRGTKGLSLACRRLLPVAREALVHNAVVTPKYIWGLVDMLQKYRVLAKLKSHLRLGKITREDAATMREVEDHVRTNMTPEGFEVCCNVIRDGAKAAALGDVEDWVRAFKEGGDLTSLGLSLVLAMCSDLDSVSLDISSIDRLHVLSSAFLLFPLTTRNSSPLWHRHVLKLLQARLKTVEIGGDSESPRGDLHVEDFLHLERLVAPFTRLVAQPGSSIVPNHRAHMADVLPPSIVLLRLHGRDTTRLHSGFFTETGSRRDLFPNLQIFELQCGDDTTERRTPCCNIGVRRELQPSSILNFRAWFGHGDCSTPASCEYASFVASLASR
ncbi:hypothetical protein M3J09_001157 [Ascochyta lentis]